MRRRPQPDVRRSLLTQKAYAEGLRALYLYTAAHQDPVSAEIVSGADPELAARVNSLLLPIVKGVGSERAYQCLTESLQILGGSGYLQDYPIEQYIRDAKIDSLYEGTTAIQAQDLIFRKDCPRPLRSAGPPVCRNRLLHRRRHRSPGARRSPQPAGDRIGRRPTNGCSN
jgi:alkylation response protein AidB-like acyl-CoA dehydrogenase